MFSLLFFKKSTYITWSCIFPAFSDEMKPLSNNILATLIKFGLFLPIKSLSMYSTKPHWNINNKPTLCLRGRFPKDMRPFISFEDTISSVSLMSKFVIHNCCGNTSCNTIPKLYISSLLTKANSSFASSFKGFPYRLTNGAILFCWFK